MSNHLMFLSQLPTPSGSVPDLARDALQATADRWFHWLFISSAVVALGVALEGWEATITLKRWWRLKRGKELAEPDEKSWAIPVAYLGLLIVVAGVVGEGIFEGLVYNVDTALRAHDSQILGKAQTDAGVAIDRASKTEEKIAPLELEAAQLYNEAKSSELAMAQLEAQIEPRRYTKAEEDAIVESCKPFAGSVVNIRSMPYDVEGAVFATYLAELLKNRTHLKLLTDGIGNNFVMNLPMFMDVRVIGPAQEEKLVQALTKSLSTPNVVVGPPEFSRPAVTTIFVGAKRLAPKP